MSKTIFLKEKPRIDSPILIKTSNNDIWTINSFHNDEDFNDGYISAVNLYDAVNEIKITDIPGVYSSADAVFSSDDTMWISFTQTIGDSSRIYLTSMTDGKVTNVINVTDTLGNYEKPRIALHGDSLWVVWQAYEQSACVIYGRRYDIADGTVNPSEIIKITPSDGRCYQPCLTVDASQCLYMFYEAFFDNRYHILVRAFDDPHGQFSAPIDIGFCEGNDQAASACMYNGGIAVVWENSFPLHKGYVYPPFPDITIPAFGHGWRINTRMGMRWIGYHDGTWTFRNPIESSNGIPEIRPNSDDSSGAPTLISDAAGRLILSYVTFNTGKHGLRLRIMSWDNSWKEIESPEMRVPLRIAPGVIAVDDQRLLISRVVRNGNEFNTMIDAVDLPVTATILDGGFFDIDSTTAVQMINETIQLQSRNSIKYEGKMLTAWWGDLHMHSNVSHCSIHAGFHSTELEEKYRFCRDVGNLDFAMVTDHDSMSDFEWFRTRKEAAFHNRSGDFIAFSGFEWTSSMMTDQENFGHRNVLFTDDNQPLLRCRAPESDTPELLWRNLDSEHSMTIPHHPSCTEHLFSWDHYHPDFDRLAEIFQVRGADEYNDCPMYPDNYGRSVTKDHSVGEALRRGYRIGFTSGGEHEGVGVTAVYAEELTRESIFAALKARHTYGTTGAHIALDFRVNGHLMGEEIPCVETPSVQIRVRGTCEISNIRLMRDGESIHEWNDPDIGAEIDWVDTSLCGDEMTKSHYYYAAITQSDGEMAWSSPVFLIP